jgi:hypothetical protein
MRQGISLPKCGRQNEDSHPSGIDARSAGRHKRPAFVLGRCRQTMRWWLSRREQRGPNAPVGGSSPPHRSSPTALPWRTLTTQPLCAGSSAGKSSTFRTYRSQVRPLLGAPHTRVAQPEPERQLAKLEVTSSSLVAGTIFTSFKFQVSTFK